MGEEARHVKRRRHTPERQEAQGGRQAVLSEGMQVPEVAKGVGGLRADLPPLAGAVRRDTGRRCETLEGARAREHAAEAPGADKRLENLALRSWRMGREQEIAYAREHGIPIKQGTEVVPYSIDDNLGAAPRRGAGSRTWSTRRTTTCSSW